MMATNNDSGFKREGTISSARFNLLSSMVGGGTLSLPLAFHQAGNLFIAPLLLIATAAAAQKSIIFLVKAGYYSSSSNFPRASNEVSSTPLLQNNAKGRASYDGVANQAFGRNARILSKGLVFVCCFFANVGYAVLLRDMLEPIVDAIKPPPESTGVGPTLPRNAAMGLVMFLITPLCTLRNLTALRNVGVVSMVSVLIVGLCVAFRSIQCLSGDGFDHVRKEEAHVSSLLRAFPNSLRELLDSTPLFISSFVCHFNVLPIYNELRCPTSDRVIKWIRSSIWPAAAFYLMVGFTGSLYVRCASSGNIHGNILLDFDEDDPLLLVGRLCLAVTITLAFPMLVVPARDILLRSAKASGLFIFKSTITRRRNQNRSPLDSEPITNGASIALDGLTTVEFEPMEISRGQNLEEPLLPLEDRAIVTNTPEAFLGDVDPFEEMSLSSDIQDNRSEDGRNEIFAQHEFDVLDNEMARIIAALIVFWSAMGLACLVQSIDVVWGLLGSSFSIVMAFLIPCGAYLKLTKMIPENADHAENGFWKHMPPRSIARVMIGIFFPLMIISTGNAIRNTFS